MKALIVLATLNGVLGFMPMWTTWSPWTPCSVTCGDNGRRSKTRECRDSDNQLLSAIKCGRGGDDFKEVICNHHYCAVDGGFSEWGDWFTEYDDRAKSCTRRRFRYCDSPTPAYGGEFCPEGDDRQFEECDIPDIPANFMENNGGTFTYENLYDANYPASHILSNDCDFFLMPDATNGLAFTFDLGDVYIVREILIRNANGDRGTKMFRIDVKMTDSENAPLRSILQGPLTDSTGVECADVPLESFPLAQPTPFRYLKFYVLDFISAGGGIQYMELK